MDSPRLRSSLVALAAAPALAGLLVFVSTTVDRPPVILSWEAEPPHVAGGAEALLRVAVSDPDGGPLRYEYDAERGRVKADPAEPRSARYTPPRDGSTSDRVSVRVIDARGQTATASTSLTIAEAERTVIAETAETTPPPALSVFPEGVRTRATAVVAREEPSAPSDKRLASREDAPAASAAPMEPEPMMEPPAPPLPVSMAPPNVSVPRQRRGEPMPDAPVGDTAPRAPEEAPNQAPVLEKGTTIKDLGTRSIVIVAQGYEPDGDPIEHEWDTKGCFDVLHQSERSIEVKLGYCGYSALRLTWRDPKGLSASAEWMLWK